VNLTLIYMEPMARMQSSNVVVSMDDDDRINQLSELLDKAIQECEEMDSLLTLYAVELSVCNNLLPPPSPG
jgi:hypothetical protein